MNQQLRTSLVVTGDASGIVGEMRRVETGLEAAERRARGLSDAMTRIKAPSGGGIQQLVNGVTGADRQMRSARESAEAFNRSIDQQDRAFKALRSSLDPLYRAEQQYAAAQDEVNRALATGVVSAEDATNVMRRLEAQYDTARQAALALDGAQEGVSAGFGSMKGQIQNASFQIADVAVQMGAGTSAARALGMQLPQLLGGFGVFGAVAGAAVAIGFPLAESFLGSADAAKEMKDQLAELDVALQSLSDNLKRSKDPDLAATFGSLSGEVRELSRLMLELDRAAELKTLRATLKKLTKDNIDPGFWQLVFSPGTGDIRPGAAAENKRLLAEKNYDQLGAKISFDEFVDRREMIDAAAKAGDVEKVLREISRLAQDMKGDGAFTDMNAALQELLTSFGQLAVQTAQVEAQWNGTAQSGRDMDEAVKSFADHQKELAALTAEIEQSEARKLELAQAEARFGADSAEAQALRVQHAREELDQRMVLAGVAEEDRARILDIYDQTVAVTDQTAAWADTMASVAAEVRGVLGALSSLGGGVVANAAKQAEINALKAGASVADAARIRMRHTRDAEFDARIAGAKNMVEREIIERNRAVADYGDELETQVEGLRAAARERDRKAAGAGRSGGARRGGRGGADRQARDEERLIQSIDREMSKLAPSYERDLQAAEKWREEALAGLSRTSTGYEQFAADVEAIYQERLRKAYEDDLKRRDDWAAGVERAFLRIEDQTTSWADMSEDLVTTWSDGLQQAFIDLNKTGSANIDDLVEHTLEMLQKMIYQMTVQPMLNRVFNWGMSALGGADPLTSALGAAGAPVTLPTAHTGGRGVMRTYSSANRQRPDERLAMLRDGEQVMTPRMLENAGAVVSALAAAAGSGGGQTVVDARPVINVINNSSAQVTGEVEETTDGRGQRQFKLVMDDAVATAMGVSGGRTQRTMRAQYNINRSGIVR
ncbi:phage tail tape measure C-terminal domain-containing protein [Paracoccus jiaweipingae]|uniref:phage tail tape measure C-terminal domain-containing protein n=1 Tax=Paracoccus sp. p2-l61 TaxID=3366950 RepID=UPI0037B5D20A